MRVGALKEVQTVKTAHRTLAILRLEIADELSKPDKCSVGASRVSALRGVARALALVAEKATATRATQQVLAAAEAIRDEGLRAEVLSGVAGSMAAAEQDQQALDVFLKAFRSAQLAGRNLSFKVVEEAAPTLAGIDGGKTLRRVYEEVMAVEAWWGG